jgi:hypothetical protein
VADLPAPLKSRGRAVPLWARGAFAVALIFAALAVVTLAALVIASLFATWLMWIAIAWLFIGRGRSRRTYYVNRSQPRIDAPRRGSAWL